jgi:hypothetical protein
MNIHDFIKKEINQLISDFPYLHCIYDYDAMSKTHLIELMGGKKEHYHSALTNILVRSMAHFKYESLAFVTENEKGVDFDNILYEAYGTDFNPISNNLFTNIINQPQISNHYSTIPILYSQQDINWNNTEYLQFAA